MNIFTSKPQHHSVSFNRPKNIKIQIVFWPLYQFGKAVIQDNKINMK